MLQHESCPKCFYILTPCVLCGASKCRGCAHVCNPDQVKAQRDQARIKARLKMRQRRANLKQALEQALKPAPEPATIAATPKPAGRVKRR